MRTRCKRYVDVLFDDERFQASFRPFCERVSFYGAINSLSQLLSEGHRPRTSRFLSRNRSVGISALSIPTIAAR